MMSLTIAKIPRTLSSKKKIKENMIAGAQEYFALLKNKGTQQNPILVECCSKLYIQFHHH
jgi:hypothetical protein